MEAGHAGPAGNVGPEMEQAIASAYEPIPGRVCRVEGCSNAPQAKHMCVKHYTRLYRHGSTKITLAPAHHRRVAPEEKIPNLAAVRRSLGMTPARFASACSLPPAIIRDLENGGAVSRGTRDRIIETVVSLKNRDKRRRALFLPA